MDADRKKMGHSHFTKTIGRQHGPQKHSDTHYQFSGSRENDLNRVSSSRLRYGQITNKQKLGPSPKQHTLQPTLKAPFMSSNTQYLFPSYTHWTYSITCLQPYFPSNISNNFSTSSFLFTSFSSKLNSLFHSNLKH